jgi:hypothetical protein
MYDVWRIKIYNYGKDCRGVVAKSVVVAQNHSSSAKSVRPKVPCPCPRLAMNSRKLLEREQISLTLFPLTVASTVIDKITSRSIHTPKCRATHQRQCRAV